MISDEQMSEKQKTEVHDPCAIHPCVDRCWSVYGHHDMFEVLTHKSSMIYRVPLRERKLFSFLLVFMWRVGGILQVFSLSSEPLEALVKARSHGSKTEMSPLSTAKNRSRLEARPSDERGKAGRT